MAKKVYFAFHYQDVVDFRANVVRNHGLTKGLQAAGYYDYSIWEESKKNGDIALKRMINSELEGTSVTAVLIGTWTYSRRWVRYEIMKSVERGNKVIGIHINSVAGKDSQTKPLGPNPFDHLGLQFSDDGNTARPVVWSSNTWVYLTDVDPYRLNNPQPAGRLLQLSHWYNTYDWIANNGYESFSDWVL